MTPRIPDFSKIYTGCHIQFFTAIPSSDHSSILILRHLEDAFHITQWTHLLPSTVNKWCKQTDLIKKPMLFNKDVFVNRTTYLKFYSTSAVTIYTACWSAFIWSSTVNLTPFLSSFRIIIAFFGWRIFRSLAFCLLFLIFLLTLAKNTFDINYYMN